MNLTAQFLSKLSNLDPYDFKVGDKVYIILSPKSKALPVADGPFPIIRVHTNNTVTVRRGARIEERINIRRLKLYDGS